MAPILFTDAIVNDRPIKVFNNGKMKRDFTYIDDIIEGMLRLLNKPPRANAEWDKGNADPGTSSAPYRIYNIGNSEPVDLMEFISTLEAKIGKKAAKEFLPMQDGDVPITYADVRDLANDIGFRPRTTIKEGIAHFIDWYSSYYQLALNQKP